MGCNGTRFAALAECYLSWLADMGDRRPRILIWADKIALSLACVGLLILFLVWLAGVVIDGEVGAHHLLASIGANAVDNCALAIVGFWAVLRVIDLLAGGQTYRLFRRLGHAIPRRTPQSPKASVDRSEHGRVIS